MILAALLFPILHPSIFLSPYNTTAQGEWIYAGAYLKTEFTGTSATLHIDTKTVQGPAPKFRWSIDGQPLQTAQAAASLPLARGLKPGRHSLIVYFAATDANYDRWNTPTQIVRLQSLELDDKATLHRPKISRKQAIFFGDSITEGAWNLGNSYRVVDKKYVDWVQNSDATQAWPFYLAQREGFEYGACASGGMSWLRTSHSQIPPLPESWRYHYKGQPRAFRRKPDSVIVNMGTNDGTRDTSQTAAAWLRTVLQEFPHTKIYVLIPFGQQNKAPLIEAVRLAANKRVRVIDLGPAHAPGLAKYGETNPNSHDGLHPNVEANQRLAAAIPPLH